MIGGLGCSLILMMIALWVFDAPLWVVFLCGAAGLMFGGVGGGGKSENDVIIGELNRLIPPYQDEAQKNLSTRTYSDKAKKEYDALINQIEHDGSEYRWK